ncbi:MAG: 23S rRNA (adenine(2503)-C(2))-methyltransferase RlmN, partial [Myxococcales bacterium]
ALHRPWLWRDGVPALGREAAAFVARVGGLALPTIVERRTSVDGATKVVLALSDGARIEAVHMPRAVRSPRVTLCLSSQVGCALGCTFCATGRMGFGRHLGAGEIVGQVLALLHALGPRQPQDVTLVFMGMGEPLHNVEAVLGALRVLCHPAGLHLPPSRITVSTAGLVPGIDRLARAVPRPLLALSLNATTDEARARTMPITRVHDLAALRAALGRWPFRPGERVTLEYVLLAGENDSDDDADRLAAWATGLPHTVNVIPFNEHEAPFARPSPARVAAFTARLHAAGCFVTVRRSRGSDVRGACGQLARAP